MKIAVIITGSNYTRNVGINKIALTRAGLLQRKFGYTVDYFYLDCIEIKFSLFEFLKSDIDHTLAMVDGRTIHLLQKYEYTPTNRFNRKFLKIYYRYFKRRFVDWEWQQDLGKYVKGYDFITAHFDDAAIIAYGAKHKYGTPYCVTWHGSDIHTIPFRDSKAREKTVLAIENASCNLFVSNALLKTSDALTTKARKEVIYNSVDDCFVKFDNDKRKSLRESFNVIDKKVVCFAGHLIDVKNAFMLPSIFERINKSYAGNVVFWIIGQGNYYKQIEEDCCKYELNYKMFGFIEPNNMPDIFNSIDVLLLPSKNEGLPLVTIEALKCGANVVGSNVGGISEVIGVENVVDLSDNFVDNFAQKVVSMLEHPMPQHLSNQFDWNKIVELEHNIYSKIV